MFILIMSKQAIQSFFQRLAVYDKVKHFSTAIEICAFLSGIQSPFLLLVQLLSMGNLLSLVQVQGVPPTPYREKSIQTPPHPSDHSGSFRAGHSITDR